LTLKNVDGKLLLNLTETFTEDYSKTTGAIMEIYNNSHDKSVQIGSSSDSCFLYFIHNGNNSGYFRVSEDGNSEIFTKKLNSLSVSWKYSDELGTFVLCGE
jgi:hypothetical protein